MYKEYFNLTDKPFELLPNPRFLFMSSTHRRAMNYLQYGFDERAGFILLTGDIGSGKTTLLRELINRLDQQAVIARVFNTQIDPVQMLGLINMDFGLEVNSLDKVTLLKNLNDFLIERYAHNERPLLIIDEAQNLTKATMEEIRLLSNLESDSEKLLQIIMVGQPELQTLLHQEDLTQLRQRLSVSCHLGRLAPQETMDYFLHRLECAGNRTAVTIPEPAFALIHDVCNGVPRLINILGDYLLLAAFSDQITELSLEFIQEVIAELRTSVAFAAASAPGQATAAPTSEGVIPPEIQEALQNLHNQQQKHEAVLKKITRKQLTQGDIIQNQLDAIGSSIRAIERELQGLTRQFSMPAPMPDNELKQSNSRRVG